MPSHPIKDESQVEALRAEVGMISMQEYHVMMNGGDRVPDEQPSSPARCRLISLFAMESDRNQPRVGGQGHIIF